MDRDAIRAPYATNCEEPKHNGCSLAQIVWLNGSLGHEKRVMADGDFITAAREDVPYLLERLRAVESQRDQALAENERLRQRLQCAESLLDRLVSAAWEASKRDEHGVLLMDMVGDGYAMTAAINYLHPHDAEEATRQALEVVVGERHDA